MGTPDPILVQFGPFAIHWYGFLIVAGIIAGGLAAAWHARSYGDDPSHLWNMLAICIVLGLIGARLYHVFSTPAGGGVGWTHYREHPLDIIRFWNGGLHGFGIFGAIIGGALGVILYAHIAHLPLLRWLDHGAIGLVLGQAIGRWGNYFNQELYGPPTDLPWGIYIAPEHRLVGLEEFTRFHPVFLYESLLNFAIFGALVLISRRPRGWWKDGDVFLLYCILYPGVRFGLEFLRPDAWRIGILAAAQWFSLILLVGAMVALTLRHWDGSHRRTGNR